MTSPGRRVIIIHEKGQFKLDPHVYQADRLYKVFLTFNCQLVFCECLDDEHGELSSVLQHFIYAWSASYQVMFIRHSEYTNQTVQATPSYVVHATKLWVRDFVKDNMPVARNIPSGQAQRPSADTPSLMVSPSDGKYRFPATNPEPKTPPKKMAKQGVVAGAPVGILAPHLPTTTADNALNKFNEVDGVDGSSLHFDGQEDQAFCPTSVAEASMETLDKDALFEMDFCDEDEYVDFLLMGNDTPLLEMSEDSADSTDDEFLNSMESY
jgi:hypothetical protein